MTHRGGIAAKPGGRYDGGTVTAMIEPTEQQQQELSVPEPVAIDVLTVDDYDPDEGAAYVNEAMAEDDANDPYLESYPLFLFRKP
jgi:hypothetical protein